MDLRLNQTANSDNNSASATTCAYQLPASMSLYARCCSNSNSNRKSTQQHQQQTYNNNNNQQPVLPSTSPLSSSPLRSSASSAKSAKSPASPSTAMHLLKRQSSSSTKVRDYVRSSFARLHASSTSLTSTMYAVCSLMLIILIMSASTCQAFLYQPINYMLDDSSLLQPASSSIDDNNNNNNNADTNLDHASFSPIYNDQSGSSAISADKDIATIIGEGLARWRDAKALSNQQQHQQQQASDGDQSVANDDQMDQMQAAASNNNNNNNNAESSLHESENGANVNEQPQSVSSAVAEMVLNGVSALASAAASSSSDIVSASGAPGDSEGQQQSSGEQQSARHPSIVEVDTSASSSLSSDSASKADLKNTRQWYNPKDSIPALRISSMATPSKHKKVYFRSEKKLTDDSMDKASLMRPFPGFGLQRRSSRGSSSPVAPQSLFQNGVIDFLRKFREVYIQTRPVSTASSSSSAASSLASAASNMMVAAASSPAVVSALSPSSSGSSSSLSSGSSSSASKPSSLAGAALASASSANGGLFGGASLSGPNRSPLTPQKYMSFWSKQFPTWVRKVLKQIRRSTLKASQNKRQQQSSAIGQASGSASATGVAEINSAHSANH